MSPIVGWPSSRNWRPARWSSRILKTRCAFVPKIVAAVVVLAVAGPWMMTTLVEYLQRTLQSIPGAVG